MSVSTATPVGNYYAMLTGGVESFDADALRGIFAPDLDFEGPLAGRRTGAEGFIAGVSRFVATARNVTVLQRLEKGNEAAAIYDAELPGGVVRFAEFFRIANGRICTLTLLYDAADFRAKGGV